MIELVIILSVAAAAGVSSVVAARKIRKRREEQQRKEELPEAESEEPAAPDPFEGLPCKVGDVVQFGDATRWPQAAIVARSVDLNGDDCVHCAILLSDEDGAEQATAMLAPPNRNLYWLERCDIDLPPTAPTRLEIKSMLLDRTSTVPVALSTIGEAPAIGDDGTFSFYEGSVGDAAVMIRGDVTRIWYGQRLSPDDFDNLGQVDP